MIFLVISLSTPVKGVALTLICSPAFPPPILVSCPRAWLEGTHLTRGTRPPPPHSRSQRPRSLGSPARRPVWRRRPRSTERRVVAPLSEDHPDPGIFLVVFTLGGLVAGLQPLSQSELLGSWSGQIRVQIRLCSSPARKQTRFTVAVKPLAGPCSG